MDEQTQTKLSNMSRLHYTALGADNVMARQWECQYSSGYDCYKELTRKHGIQQGYIFYIITLLEYLT